MAFIRVLRMDVPKDECCINGRFFYSARHKPLNDGHARADAYIDDQSWLGARFCVKGFQEAIGGNAYAPTEKLQSLRVCLSIIAYRKWNLMGNGCFEGLLEVESIRTRYLRSAAFISGKGPAASCGRRKPLNGLATSRREWYESLNVSRWVS